MALILGQVFFAIIVIYLNYSGFVGFDYNESKFVFLLITIFSAFGGIYGSNYFFKLKLISIAQTNGLYNKLVEYRAACIAKWAMLEIPSFFAITGFFLTGDLTFIIITIGIISFFLMNRPGPEKTCAELELDTPYKIKVMDPDSVISEND